MERNKDIKIYSIGKKFLIERLKEKGKNEDLLFRHLEPKIKFNDLKEVYLRLLESGANRSLMWNVITSPLNGEIRNLEKVLFDFDVFLVLKKYSTPEKILEDLVRIFDLKINLDKRGLWFQYSTTILSGAKFLSQFDNFRDFDNFVRFFHKDNRARKALPLLLKEEINGFGLALACDF
ncbi:MAG: hypothetical protein JEY97_05660 [Bacteroidales bacterium]|nr:hypothetical protein [Bacteroidales bacterium]